jgi:hypothetical protein
MRWLRVTMVGLLLGVACAAAAAELWPQRTEDGVPLYFSLEVLQRGQVIARPQLVGASGHDLREVLRSRDGTPRMELLLSPTLRGKKLGVDMQLELPDEHGLGKSIALEHGQQAQVRLSGDVEVKLLAMKVQSPEFEAYMAHAPAIAGEADQDDE